MLPMLLLLRSLRLMLMLPMNLRLRLMRLMMLLLRSLRLMLLMLLMVMCYSMCHNGGGRYGQSQCSFCGPTMSITPHLTLWPTTTTTTPATTMQATLTQCICSVDAVLIDRVDSKCVCGIIGNRSCSFSSTWRTCPCPSRCNGRKSSEANKSHAPPQPV